MDAIARYFKFAERGTNLATEARAGLTTFMVMSYIIVVNPAILSNAGIPIAAAAAATALVAGVMTILMGVVANVPLALAAGLGINGVLAFGLVVGLKLSPEGAMGVIVLEGIVVTVLVLVGLREAIMKAVPISLRRAIGAGIGLFILFIGFVDGGLIGRPAGGGPVPVEWVFSETVPAFVTLLGLLLTVALYVRKVRAALLIGIVVTTIIAIAAGVQKVPSTLYQAPDFSTLGHFNLVEIFNHIGILAAILTIFSFLLTDFFDTMGTATGIAEQAKLTDKDDNVEGIGRILLVDSVAAIAGGVAGISSNTSYIESAAGVAEGGRTGFTSVVTGVLFLFAILLAPLATLVPFQATAPVLILVGYLMFTMIKGIDFGDAEEGLPALLTLVLMPLSFSITVGIGAGFVAWVVIKVVLGKAAQIHPLMWVVAAAFAVYFAQGWISSFL